MCPKGGKCRFRIGVWVAEEHRVRRGLGDRLASALHWLGFRPWAGCGCEQRKAWLNRLGDRLAAGWAWLRGYSRKILGKTGSPGG